MKTALTIAGSDCSGGAGIQADIKTMMANGVYAMSVITALTAQNTMGVNGIHSVPADFVGTQLDSVMRDIFPDAVKIGMVCTKENISMISRKLLVYQAKNIVIDPVMVSTSGTVLLQEDAIEKIKKELFPLATLLTPNIPEAELLTGMQIRSEEDMMEAATKISREYHCACLLKGGHQIRGANDLLLEQGISTWFRTERIHNPNNHGTGCTLSSAIASNLAKGCSLAVSVEMAKKYLTGALSAMLDLGKGNGPLNHGYQI